MPPQDLLIMYVIKPKERVTFGEGNGNPLQYSCLGSPMDRRAWYVTVHGVARVGHDLATKSPSENTLENILL